ncbi:MULTISPECIES: M15 family metallopeptidase [Sphingomonas]|uniref:M15 family metallopeptidase n=1 Tax=Sphingomonas TaxID=13687 RepID=UPI000DEF97B4|nr:MULTISPECIES: M15 family metallopeptidase [Sphingomonas]
MTKLADMVPVSSIPNLNVGLSSAREETMISCLGSPQLPLTTDDTPERASALVRKLEFFKKIGGVNANGIAPAVKSLATLLSKAFRDNPELRPVLRGDGMLVVRLRRPTDGHPSKLISNHAWGTAIDLRLDKTPPPANTGHVVPNFIALLVPYFNEAGWYSGIGFADDMHFEVADQTIRTWAHEGELGYTYAQFERFSVPLGRAGIPDHLIASHPDHELELAETYKPFVAASAAKYSLDPLLVYALGSRESDWGLTLKPPGPAGTGDWRPRSAAKWGYSMPPDGLGWGRGLLQADYQQPFAQTGNWRDPGANIDHGCRELAENIAYFDAHKAPNIDPLRAGVAAYNCGRGGVRTAIAAGLDVDHFTTGKNYSADVLYRRTRFKSLVA